MIVSRKEVAIENLSSTSNNVFDLANLVLRLLHSNDGAVLRRLLMTAVSAIDPDPFLYYTTITFPLLCATFPFVFYHCYYLLLTNGIVVTVTLSSGQQIARNPCGLYL